jgi:hypothetical protein
MENEEKEINHSEREHARFSPSSMKRYIECPVSAYYEPMMPPQETTTYAAEGTLAHEAAEQAAAYILKNHTLDGFILPDADKYDLQMTQAAYAYAKFVYKTVEPHLSKPHYWAVEKRVEFDTELWGTADFTFIYDEDNLKNVILIDYKYGTAEVSPIQNLQLAAYLKCIDMEYTSAKDFGTATSFIYQPKLADTDEENSLDLENYNPEGWVVTFKHLEEYYFNLIDAMMSLVNDWEIEGEVSKEDAAKYTRVGDHCHYCPVKSVCKAYKQHHAAPVLDAFKAIAHKLNKKELGNKEAIIDAGLLDIETIVFIALHASDITKFVDAVKQIPKHIIETTGEDIPGVKLVQINQRRKFIDDKVELIKGLKEAGILKPVKLIEKIVTLTEAESQVGKGKVDHLISNIGEKSTKLVADDDKGLKFIPEPKENECFKLFESMALKYRDVE